MSRFAPTFSSTDIKELPDQTAWKLNDMASMLDGVWDTLYPIGTYYETSDADFDPAHEWGGKWEEVGNKWHRIA